MATNVVRDMLRSINGDALKDVRDPASNQEPSLMSSVSL
jgi:hypothetical protein